MGDSLGPRFSKRHAFAAIVSIAVLLLTFAVPASAATAKKLLIDEPVADATAGRPISVTVRVVDQLNRLVDSDAPVTMSIANNPAGATLYGLTQTNAVGGIATFTNLRIVSAGTGFTLRATSPDLVEDVSDPFDITGAAQICTANGCPPVSDPQGTTPTTQNGTTGTVQVPTCEGAGTNTDFVSYDETVANFCEGGCLGAAIFFASDCETGDPWVITYRLDKSLLPTDKGAPHIVLYIENEDGSVDVIPDCVRRGVLNPAPVCVSSQNKNGQGDSISQILKRPGDPKIGG